MLEKRILNESRPCAICGDRNEAAELSLGREQTLPGKRAASLGAVQRFPLCSAHFEWAASLVERSGRGLAPGETPLGMPVREAVAVSPGQQCGGCNATIGAETGVLDLVPSSRERVAGPLRRHSGRIYQLRLCRQCRAWWETTLRDSSAVRGDGTRAWEGPAGGWLAATRADVATLGLGARDDETIAATVGAVGCSSQRLHFEDLAKLEQPPGTLFIGANRAGRASRIIARLPNAFRRVSVVVGRPDSLDDLAEALRVGAGDFLSWPLSPQQVAGAIDRAHQAGPGEARDPETGLTVIADGLSIHKRPAHRLTATLPAGMDLLEGALLARRFLRGYDRVGLSASGDLAFAIPCEREHLPRVVERIELVLGEGARVWEGDPPRAADPGPEAEAATEDAEEPPSDSAPPATEPEPPAESTNDATEEAEATPPANSEPEETDAVELADDEPEMQLERTG